MKRSHGVRRLAHIYLCLVPLIAFILAFAVGHVSPVVYVPVWIAHSVLMLYLIWQLGAKYATYAKGHSGKIAAAAALFVLPWILATIFAGMGPPPFDINGWADLAGEQRVRFGILVVCGVSLAAAFSLLYELARNEEAVYPRSALTAILVALPLFIVVLGFWGTIFTDTAIVVSKSELHKSPEWLAPWRHMIDYLSTIEICLFYLATALLAISMKHLNWLSSKACLTYLAISLFAIAVTLLPASVPEPLVVLNYVAGIPAITMLMPYLIGLALLRRIEISE